MAATKNDARIQDHQDRQTKKIQMIQRVALIIVIDTQKLLYSHHHTI